MRNDKTTKIVTLRQAIKSDKRLNSTKYVDSWIELNIIDDEVEKDKPSLIHGFAFILGLLIGAILVNLIML